MKILLIVLCLFLPFLAVLIKKETVHRGAMGLPSSALGPHPGVIYGIYQATKD